jgi:oligopeptidase B
VTGLEVSLYNNILAYGVDTVSRRKYTIYFKNLTTGENFPESLPNTTGQAAWANDNKTVFYTVKDESLRPFKIFRHVLGSDVAQDKEIYHEKDETFECNVSRTKSRMYLMIASDSTTSNEYRFLDAGQPEGEFKVIQPRERNLEYSVDHYRNRWFILTNWKAKNFRLISTPLNQGLKENWRDVIPHRDDVLLENFELFNNYLVVDERKDGLTRLRIFHGPKNTEHYIEFGEKAYTAYIALNPEFDTQWLRFGYSSLTTPRTIFDYHMYTHEKILLKREEVLGGFNPELYQTERLFATAPDGVKIPISLVWRKDRLEKNGGKPLLLYGYGSYGYSSEPAFSSALLSLLDRGFIYAIAHIRGGQEMGRDWYENGKLLKKKNTFSDFIACAEHLVAEKYSRPDRLFAMGGSAGGLLMGAVVNMRPELFRGVIAGVPWVDVVTTMLDSSIPLTTSEYDEWGNPADKQFYDYMLSYSPYDNVTARNYPALLVTTGLHDSQVQYWEPAKWVAKLRDLKTDKNILVLYTNMEAGHGGASGRFQRYKETALEHAFLLDLVGIKE